MLKNKEYIYPTIQTVVRETVFILSSVFDSNEYDLYRICINGGQSCLNYSHDAIKESLVKGLSTRKVLSNFANGKEFIALAVDSADNEQLTLPLKFN